MNIVCREILFGSEDYQRELELRDLVLRQPLGLSWTAEELAKEATSHHVGCFAGPMLVGALVLSPETERSVRMRQVAVDGSLQRTGIGSCLVAFAEEFCRDHGFEIVTAHAREEAVPFYRKHGYAVEGEGFVEVGILHRVIRKSLVASPRLDPSG